MPREGAETVCANTTSPASADSSVRFLFLRTRGTGRREGGTALTSQVSIAVHTPFT